LAALSKEIDMPRNKDLKRLIRTRMQKTGESYTTARAHITRKKKSLTGPTVPEARYAEVAGMRDDAVYTKTGRTWKQWVRVLDAIDAGEMPHKLIAAHLMETHGLPAWWAQTVTVGYERIRGLRDIGQRRGGAYEVNKSKTFSAPLSTLYRAFSTARIRSRWLPGVELSARKAAPGKTLRINWPDGTRVDVNFTAKGDAKSQVAVQHKMLSSKSEAEKMRAFWTERLGALVGVVSGTLKT
jgi:hypothetical protein